jgi:hypothetical protein
MALFRYEASSVGGLFHNPTKPAMSLDGPKAMWARPIRLNAIGPHARKDRPQAALQSLRPGQNSFGIKLCQARSDRKLTTIE